MAARRKPERARTAAHPVTSRRPDAVRDRSTGPTGLAATLSDEIERRLRRAEQRPTTNRIAIINALRASLRPLTIPEILDARPELAQSSVYRNLAVLERATVVHRIVTDHEFARYELAEDLTGHHHHLICVECGTVEDVDAPAALERSVRSAADAIALTTGFRAERHRIDLLGRCRACA
ncbi:MAG TPA: Fur family transcriptional regulator [Acidimicrobiia bacterium]|nr:Fur family transcriptional regulator [Acidimicrobiia bacterium]